MDKKQDTQTTNTNKKVSVYLYIPNLIGYARVLFLFVFYLLANRCIKTSIFFYILSTSMDFFDGMFARKYNQCSKFGAMLDQLTDRFGTLVLVFAIIKFKTNLFIEILFWNTVLDLVSHWLQTINAVKQNQHHKSMKNEYKLLDMYYNNEHQLLRILCFTNETFHIAAVLFFGLQQKSLLVNTVFYATLPFAIMKSYMNLLQLLSNVLKIVQQDEEEREKKNQLQF